MIFSTGFLGVEKRATVDRASIKMYTVRNV